MCGYRGPITFDGAVVEESVSQMDKCIHTDSEVGIPSQL